TWSVPVRVYVARFAFLQDFFAILVVVVYAITFSIRKIQLPDRFRGSHMEEADRILLTILGIVTTLLLWNASRIALGIAEHPPAAPVADALSGLFGAGRGLEAAERVMVWVKLLLVPVLPILLPRVGHTLLS